MRAFRGDVEDEPAVFETADEVAEVLKKTVPRRRSVLRNRWAVVIFAVAALAAAGRAGVRYLKGRSEAQELKKLVAAKVLNGEFVVKTQASGVVQPLRKVTVMPIIGGRMERVLVQEGDRVSAGQIVAWMSSTDRSAILDAAGAQGPEELKKWQDDYKPTPIIAPIGGDVIKRAVEPGQTITPSNEIVTLSDRLIVKTYVDESDIGKVRIGQKAEFVLDAYRKDRLKGEVVSIAFDSTLQNNVTVYEVKIRPLTGAALLRSGMTAEVYVEIEKKKNAIYVPKRAVKYKEGETVVLLRKSGQETSSEQKVSVGANNERFTELLSGVSAGDTVMMPASSVPDEDEHAIEVN